MATATKPKGGPGLLERIRRAYRTRKETAVTDLATLVERIDRETIDPDQAAAEAERLGIDPDALARALELRRQRTADRQLVEAMRQARTEADSLAAEIASEAVALQQHWARGQASLAEKRLRLSRLQMAERPGQDAEARLRKTAPTSPAIDEALQAIDRERRELGERDRELLERLHRARAAELSARNAAKRQSSLEWGDSVRLPEARAKHAEAVTALEAVEAERAKLQASLAELDRRQHELDKQRAAL